ncbi:GPI mannosyltransferase 4 [Adelges cooleyi]|uniref:GPI mannosyltransferase 4 n=1 Tax=Adelges cooleyi TaxID=133065 RepID=UPI00217FDAA6|nr:GPI mannosyltransferase 4 [Adelges cooleyi]
MIAIYYVLVAFRILSSVFYQNGYIHPDEFFQSIEIITGDFFGVVHKRPWEYREENPVRSISLLYAVFGAPLFILKIVFGIYEIPWTPMTLLGVFRLITCLLSFLSDYALYKICKLCGVKPDRYLVLLSSSYVIIVYGTRAFTNSIELVLLSLLLWLVIDSMKTSEKFLAAQNEIFKMYADKTSIQDQVEMSKKLRKLPYHLFNHCFEIAAILSVGTFNRPTFLIFAIAPIFFWISRGFSKDIKYCITTFNLRFFVLVLCVAPIMLVLVLIDSYYFGHVTHDAVDFVYTPLNFIKYNLDSTNLAEHGIHFRLTHAFVNMPLLFSVLVPLFVHNLNLNKFLEIFRNGQYNLLPNIHRVDTLMVANVIIPLALLSLFPHQEPRFLLPLLLPIVFTTANYFSINSIKNLKPLFFTWCLANVFGFLFYGHLHQAGVTPMISQLATDIKHSSNTLLIHSHVYTVPVGLLLVPEPAKKFSRIRGERRVSVHDLGSSLDVHTIVHTVMNTTEHLTIMGNPKLKIYLALTGALHKSFEDLCDRSDIKFTKKLFFPHVSVESLNYYKTYIVDLILHDNRTYVARLKCLYELFSLVLYEITLHRTAVV